MVRYFKTVFFLLFILLIAGCSSTSVKEEGSANKNESSTEMSDNILKVALNDDPTTLGPYVYSTTNDMNLHRAIFNSLYNYNLETVELEPELVTADISDDQLTYTLNLQENVYFHNDEIMKADDIKHSIESAMDPEASRTSSQLEAITNIEVVDDQTVKVELKHRDSALLDAFVEIHVTPNDESIDHTEHPIGTGPFKFINWERNTKIELAKFENYWKEGLPLLDGIEFISIPDDSVKLLQLQGEQVDFIDIIATSSVQVVQDDESLNIPEATEEGNSASHLMLMNNSKAPFDDIKFRQAINYSLNRESMKESLFGNFVVKSSPIPLASSEFNSDIPNYDYDIDKAKQLLNDSNYSDEKVVLMYHKIDLMYEIVAKITEQNLQSMGVNVELKGVPIAEWVETVFDQKDYDIALTGIIPKPSTIDLLNHPYGKINGESIQWDNKEWYNKLNDLKEASDKEAEELIQELQMIVMEESPAIIIGGVVSPPAMSAKVEGFVMHPQNLLIFEKVSIAD